jgi:hypothetical protein
MSELKDMVGFSVERELEQENSEDLHESDLSSEEDASLSDDGIMAAPEFPRFGDLPTEVRLKIWKEAAFEPRIILDVHRKEIPVPGILHTNREAREEALHHYELGKRRLGSKAGYLRDNPKFTKEYYNFASDIFLSYQTMKGRWRENGGCGYEHKIRHIAFEAEGSDESDEWYWYPGDWNMLGMKDVRLQRTKHPDLEDVRMLQPFYRGDNIVWTIVGIADYPQLRSDESTADPFAGEMPSGDET